MKKFPIREIAQTDEARFLWWVQKTFRVLPTDSRFLDLTDEQLELMFEHYCIDNRPIKTNDKSIDPDYNEPEHYYDPEFDDLWNAVDEEDDSDEKENFPNNFIGKKQFLEDSNKKNQPENSRENTPISSYNPDEWEEV